MGWEDGNKATDNRKLIFFIPIMHLSSCKTNKVVQLSDVHHGGQKRNAYENRLKLNTHEGRSAMGYLRVLSSGLQQFYK